MFYIIFEIYSLTISRSLFSEILWLNYDLNERLHYFIVALPGPSIIN